LKRKEAGRLSGTDRTYLRFARDLKRLGPVKSVKCQGRKNLPGTVKFR